MNDLALIGLVIGLIVLVPVLLRRPRPSTPTFTTEKAAALAAQAYLDGVQVGLDAAHAGLQAQFRRQSVLFGEYASDGVFAGSYVASHKRGVRPLFGIKEGLTVTEAGAQAAQKVWVEGMPISAGMLKQMQDGSYRQFVIAPDGDGYVLGAVS